MQNILWGFNNPALVVDNDNSYSYEGGTGKGDSGHDNDKYSRSKTLHLIGETTRQWRWHPQHIPD